MVSGTSVAGRAGRGRASALVLVCALAACVALLGSLSGAEEPVAATFLAVKAELQEKQSVHLGGHSMALAAKADSLDTVRRKASPLLRKKGATVKAAKKP